MGSLMFYGGSAVAAIALLTLIAALFFFRSGKKRMRGKLDEEYGKDTLRKGH